jgi:hypothetical protein
MGGFGGCLAFDEAINDGRVGETQQAFTGSTNVGLSVIGQSTDDLDLGPDSSTCFLSALKGNFADLRTFKTGLLSDSWLVPRASIVHNETTHRLSLSVVAASPTSRLSASVVCINKSTDLTKEKSWTTGQGAVFLSASAGKQCFLTEVSGFDGPSMFNSLDDTAGDSWGTVADSASVTYTLGNFYLTGTGHASARALCIDISAQLVATSGNGLGVHALVTANAQQIGSVNGTQCFLYGVGGQFRTSSFTDGVDINYNSGTLVWSYTTAPSKGAWVACVQ